MIASRGGAPHSERSLVRSTFGLGLFGAAVVAVHVVALIFVGRACRSPSLAVDTHGAQVDQTRSLTGTVPSQLQPRVTQQWETPPGPGLQRLRWAIERRGGQVESVTATQLVGPFIDPQKPACTGRVVVGQALLQNSAVALVTKLADENLRGTGAFGIGDYRSLGGMTLTWAQLGKHPDDRSLLPSGSKPERGYLRIAFDVHFDRVTVPMVLALVPELHNGELSTAIYSRAKLEFGNRVLQWASDKLGGDRLATKLARKELSQFVLSALAPPPPVPLPGGGTLRFTYCDQPLQIVDSAYAALPMAVVITPLPSAPTVLPPTFGPTTWAPVPATTTLALDLSLDGLNSVLFECWRHGLLDRVLADAKIDQAFNNDELVREFLTVRISPLRLALPPVAQVRAGALVLGTEAALSIADTDRAAPLLGHAWSQISLQFDASAKLPHASLQQLALTCEPTPGHLEACYPLLAQAVGNRTTQFDQSLTNALATTLNQLFTGTELTSPDVPGSLVLGELSMQATVTEANAALRLNLAAALRQ